MNTVKAAIIRTWEQRPLLLLIYLGLSLRLLAAIFSRGYGWHDDHFLTIEPPHSWVHGGDYNNWLPSSNGGEFKPSGHSFTYSGMMFGIFSIMESLGMQDPQWQMLIIRALHAVFSLLVISYGFRIAGQLFDKKIASTVGMMLTLFYFMPFLSVRNLVEMVCLPFLMGGTWFLIRPDKEKWKWLLLSAFFFGMAFSIRYQTILFTAGTGLVLLFTLPFLRTLIFGAVFLGTVALTQGLVDYLIWGVPFAEFWEYFTYNQSAGATDYFVREWYMYLVVLAGIFIPPFSLMLIAGFISGIRKHLLLVIPILIFFLFHSWFPNKQERFILPVVPFFLILGYGGWIRLREAHLNSARWQRIIRVGMIFFWTLNSIALIPLTFMYSKKSRVETMTFLGQQADFVSYIIEDSNNTRITMLPDFYSGKGYSSWRIMQDIPASWTCEQVMYQDLQHRPNYMLFMYEENLGDRVKKAGEYFTLEKMQRFDPGLMDKLLHWLNPNNRNEAITVYRIHWKK